MKGTGADLMVLIGDHRGSKKFPDASTLQLKSGHRLKLMADVGVNQYQHLTRVVHESNRMVRLAIARCNRKPASRMVTLAAKLCFGLELAEDELLLSAVVVPTLELVLNGINCNQVIKIGDVRNEDSARAFVPMRDKPATKPHHTVVSIVEKGKSLSVRAGAMHLDSLHLLLDSDKLITRTYIHEASHKYAGTSDYYHFDDAGDPKCDAQTMQGALDNADSYAWFVLYVGGN